MKGLNQKRWKYGELFQGCALIPKKVVLDYFCSNLFTSVRYRHLSVQFHIHSLTL